MSISPLGGSAGRTTTLQVSDGLLGALRRTQTDLLDAQNEISSGKSVSKPSDAPSKTAAILLVRRLLAVREQTDRNLDNATAVLNSTDQALSDANSILIEARNVALSQTGVGSSADTRKNQASVIDAQLQSMLDIANRRYQDVSLFGGSVNPDSNTSVFQSFLGGVRYTGSRTNLGADVGFDQPLDINSNGEDAFQSLSARVKSGVNLDAQATTTTPLADVNGAQGRGVRQGSVIINVDSTDVVVDLSGAKTLGDVASRLTAAIQGVDPSAGSLAIGSSGLSLTAASGHTITITDQGVGQTAADLGIAVTASGATVAGADLDTRITSSTSIASLGGTVDWTSGLKIDQGGHVVVADFTGAQTVQDLQNVVDQLNLGLRLEVNDSGTALNLVTEVSGLSLSVGENDGTTARDLGLTTLSAQTKIADTNFGTGIQRVQGQDDFEIDLHDGTTFRVNLDGATTISDVIGKITGAAAVAGLTVGMPGTTGTNFNVGLATNGAGLALEDGSSGSGQFRVLQLGQSMAADNLGIYVNAGTGSTIQGSDVGKVQIESVFTHLIQLRDSLTKDDSRGITIAGSGLETDINQMTLARADVGTRGQRVDQQQKRSAELKLSEQSMLSDLQDSDVTEAIVRFTRLQQQLQGSLQVGAKIMQTSLLDYLR
ncbi:MAG: flagellin [Planctomycetota bacterium]|nr:flagellin [Planctomycetota bacterium]